MNMKTDTRPFRAFGAMFLAAVAVLLLAPGAAEAQDRPLRLSWQEFVKEPTRLASFRKGVEIMKARSQNPDHSSKEYRTSWEYWGAIHGFLGTRAGLTKAQYIQFLKSQGLWRDGDERFFEGLSDLTPPDLVATRTWGKCEHGTPYFFPWHRLYLFYFERVLRAAAGDDTLRLPYWDYTDPNQVSMPVEFTQPTYTDLQGQSVPNPLFDARRASQQITLDERATNIDDILPAPDFDSFRDPVENNVHGYVHCTVNDCPLPLMGAVPVSSNDPIFWVHHANIDRIWECWLAAGHQNPAGSFQDRAYTFLDENGAEVTRRVRDLFGPSSIVDYAYDHVTNCGRAAPAVAVRSFPEVQMAANPKEPKKSKAASALAAKPSTMGTVSGVKISSAVTKVPMELPKSGPKSTSMRDVLNESSPVPTTAELVLEGINYKAHPGSMFNIYLEKKSDPAQRQFVGTLSFFSTPMVPGMKQHHAAPSTRRVFDVTDSLRTLVGPSLKVEDVNVVFEATTGQAGSKPEEAAARFHPEVSDLSVAKVELRLKPVPSR
jgi:hypothetical protein